MQVIEDEVIGELRYLTVKFDQAELLAGHIGVISQGAVRRYFEGENSDLKVKKCGGLKLDSQRDIVTMRFGIVNNQPEEWLHPLYGGSLKSIAEETAVEEDIKRIEAAADGECIAISDVFHKTKLLNPGYDEIQAKCVTFQREYDAIVVLYDKLEIRYSKLIEKYDALVKATGLENHIKAEDAADLAADLAAAKEAIESADSVPLSGTDLGGDNQKPLGQNSAGEYSGPHGSD